MKLTSKLFVLALFLVSLTAAAQRKQSVLWQVSGHGLKHPSYLFGTVHTLPPSVLDKFPVKQYMRQAQFGVFESGDSSIAPAQPKMASAGAPHQPPLDSLFSPRDYAAVDSFCMASSLGSIKAHNYDTNLQVLLYAAIRIKQSQSSAIDPLVSLDESIIEEMKRLGKPAFGLDADNDPDIQQFLTSYTYLAKMIVSVTRGKSPQGYYVPDDSTGSYVTSLTADMHLREDATGTMKEITVRRNLLWVPQLEQKLGEGPCFVAVGLGHLQYKSGLIKLLRQKGYRVKPVALASSN
jgi:uncharacterized protein YbaP (TraB family)